MIKIWGTLVLLLLLALPAKAQTTLLVTEDELATAVKKEFVEQGMSEAMEIEFFGGQTSFNLANAISAKIMITKLKYDEGQNKFSAYAEIFADGKPAVQTPLSGRFYTMNEVWVPAENIEKDTIITAEMLKPIQSRANRIKAIMIIDKNKLIDKQTKKSLKEGRIVSEREVGEVVIIKKGKVVTSYYNTKGMSITAKAEALEDGIKGHTIAVMNTKSARKFFARVIDADTVEIPTDVK